MTYERPEPARLDERLPAHLEVDAMRPDDYVRLVYRLALRREPDAAGETRALAKLADSTLSRATLLHELATGEEFEHVRAYDDAVAFASWARAHGERPRELSAPAWNDGRLIEIPWVLARYRGERRVLDAGYAYAEAPYLAAVAGLRVPELTGVDLATADVPGLTPVVADLRTLPFADRAFDLVLCVSTLEHVGADASVYGHGAERDESGMAAALGELARVLDSRGRVLLTVPLGERGDFVWWVRLPLGEWHELFARAGLTVFEEEGYRLDDDGWRAVPLPDGDLLCTELRPRRRADRLRRLVG